MQDFGGYIAGLLVANSGSSPLGSWLSLGGMVCFRRLNAAPAACKTQARRTAPRRGSTFTGESQKGAAPFGWQNLDESFDREARLKPRQGGAKARLKCYPRVLNCAIEMETRHGDGVNAACEKDGRRRHGIPPKRSHTLPKIMIDFQCGMLVL